MSDQELDQLDAILGLEDRKVKLKKNFIPLEPYLIFNPNVRSVPEVEAQKAPMSVFFENFQEQYTCFKFRSCD